MNSLQISYFLTLCSEKSFSKAAQKLFVTQPSFSQMIKKIESEAGTELIDRSTSPIKLTEAGELFYSACLQYSAIEEDLHNAISNLSELKSGRLSVGTTPFRAATMMAKSIACFKHEYSGVEITIAEGSVKYLKNAVADGEIDLAICSGSFDSSVYHSEELADERMYAAVSPDSPINEKLKASLLTESDIAGNSLRILKALPCPISLFADEPYIMMHHGEGIADASDRIFSEMNIRPNTVLKAQSPFTALSFVMEGMGFMLMPDSMIKYGNIKAHPCYYPIDSIHAVSKIKLVTRKNRYMSRAASEYSRLLKQLIRSGTWRV